MSRSTVTRLYVGRHDQCRHIVKQSVRGFLDHEAWDSVVQIRTGLSSQRNCVSTLFRALAGAGDLWALTE